MAETTEFRSPLTVRGARLKLPRTSWNDLRSLIEGQTSPGLDDGRYHSHLVSRWHSGMGIDASRLMLHPDADIAIEAARPETRERAAYIGALLAFAVRSGQQVKVDLAPPAERRVPADLLIRCGQWAVHRFGWGAEWMVRPSLHRDSIVVALPESLSDAPQLVSDAYSSILDVSKEAGRDAVAGLFGAVDFETAVAALESAEEVPTPYLAAHTALGVLLDPGEPR